MEFHVNLRESDIKFPEIIKYIFYTLTEEQFCNKQIFVDTFSCIFWLLLQAVVDCWGFLIDLNATLKSNFNLISVLMELTNPQDLINHYRLQGVPYK